MGSCGAGYCLASMSQLWAEGPTAQDEDELSLVLNEEVFQLVQTASYGMARKAITDNNESL